MQDLAGSPALCEKIRDRITRSPQQRIPFAEFMALALYDPQHGYYTAGSTQLGPTGDFITSAHLSQDFAELLTQQLVEMWEHLGQPDPFHLVEMGPGQGLLAETILSTLQAQFPRCLEAVQYTLVETSPGLRAVQQQRLQPWQAQGCSLRWDPLEALAPASITGCLFANELVDALPVHRVILTAAGLQEQYVTLAAASTGQPFAPVVGPLSTSALGDYFEQVGLALTHPPYPIGYTTEVNLAALTWLTTVAQVLRQGYVLTIDYGYPAERYYRPTRSQGTLQCYSQHRHHDNPFIYIGQQDLTAHVDFTALQRHGAAHGLETLGLLPQELFLMALGLGDRLTALSTLSGTDGATLNSVIQRRDALHQLINPLGLGKFTVLIQGKGLRPEQKPLKGLTIPPWA